MYKRIMGLVGSTVFAIAAFGGIGAVTHAAPAEAVCYSNLQTYSVKNKSCSNARHVILLTNYTHQRASWAAKGKTSTQATCPIKFRSYWAETQ